MHHGQFPEPPRLGKKVDYEPSQSAAAELRAMRQRRMFLLSCVGLVAAGSGALMVGTGAFGEGSTGNTKAEYSPRGTLAWALEMLGRTDQDLLSAAGDLERVSMIHRGEQALVPVFERVLDLAMVSSDEHADLAGACAIRSLGRLGRPEFARDLAPEIEGSGRMPLMVEALQMLRRRRNGGR